MILAQQESETMQLWDSFLFILDNIYKWLNIIFVRDLRYSFMGVELLLTGFVQSLEFLKKCWNLPNNFPELEKVWKMETKSGKKESLESFFKKTIEMIFFPFGKIFVAHHKKTFLRFSRSILITYLITLSLE